MFKKILRHVKVGNETESSDSSVNDVQEPKEVSDVNISTPYDSNQPNTEDNQSKSFLQNKLNLQGFPSMLNPQNNSIHFPSQLIPSQLQVFPGQSPPQPDPNQQIVPPNQKGVPPEQNGSEYPVYNQPESYKTDPNQNNIEKKDDDGEDEKKNDNGNIFSPLFNYLWNDPTLWEPETYYKNFTSKRKATDVWATVVFLINLVVTIVLYVLSNPNATEHFIEEAKGLGFNTMSTIGLISIGIAYGLAVLTLFFCCVCPRAYVRYAAVINIFLGLAAVIPVSELVSPYFYIWGGIALLYIIIVAVFNCRRIAFSACIMNASAIMLCKFPSLILFNLFMLIIQSCISYIFSTGAFLAWANGISYWIYIYVAFSYFFVSRTITFVTYCVSAGVASSWYFLNKTEYQIEHPIWISIKNAFGPNFGPCALAGLIEGFTKVLDWIKEQGTNPAFCCFACFQCVCQCFLCIFKCIVGFITKYSLIYCAMFGIPAKEGVCRWSKTRRNRMVKQVVNSAIIKKTFDFYTMVASVIATSVGGIIGKYFYTNGSIEMIFLSSMCAFFALNGVLLISQPIIVLSDTLFIGFGEAPLRLETGAKELFDLFDDDSKLIMQRDIDRAKGEGICCGLC